MLVSLPLVGRFDLLAMLICKLLLCFSHILLHLQLSLLLLLNEIVTVLERSPPLNLSKSDLVLSQADAKLQPFEELSHKHTALGINLLLGDPLEVAVKEVQSGVLRLRLRLDTEGAVGGESL